VIRMSASINDVTPSPVSVFLSRSNITSSCNHAKKNSGEKLIRRPLLAG
jgi:hypothetical protein